MTETKRRYKKQCKTKYVTFYKHEKDLLKYADSINFQAEVKKFLRREVFLKENDIKL